MAHTTEKIPKSNKTLESSISERIALKQLISLVREAREKNEFSDAAADQEIPKLGAIKSQPEEISIWGVPLLKDQRTDAVLLKFLRAWNFDVDESFEMLKNTIRWRREFNVDGLVEQRDLRDPLLQKASYVHRHDREGRPVWYNVQDEFNSKEMYLNVFADEEKMEIFVRAMIQFWEKSIRNKLDFSVGGRCTFLSVVDLKKSRAAKKNITIAINQVQQLVYDHYPEFIEKEVFINVPWWYLALYSLIRPFMSEQIKSKFILAVSSKAAATLFKYISPENLPIQYSGLYGADAIAKSNMKFK